MRHFKLLTNTKSFKHFICDNAEHLILGAIIVIAIICGMIFSLPVKDLFLLNTVSTPQTKQLFFNLFLEITVYIFLLFFCGTSSIGFISPTVLAMRGFFMGCMIRNVDLTHDMSVYILAIMPYIVFSFALLIQVSKCSITLSLRIFRLCTGSGIADLPMIFKRFIIICGISVVISAAISFIFSLIYIFLLT